MGGECVRYSDGEVAFYVPDQCQPLPEGCLPAVTGTVEEWEWTSNIWEPE